MVKTDDMTKEQILTKIRELRQQIKEFRSLEKERKEAEDALKGSEEKYRNLFENAEVGMYRTKLDGTAVLAVNQKIAEIVSMSKEEILSNPAFIHWENPTYREEMVQQLTQKGSIMDYEICLVDKKGEVKTCQVSGKILKEEGIFEGSLVDITDRKKAEEAMRESEKKLGIALECLGANAFVNDGDLRFTWAYNPAPGFSQEAILGKTDEDILPPEQASVFTKIKKRVLETGIGEHFEHEIEIEKKSHVFEVLLEPLRSTAGDMVGVIGVSRDITERKKAEEALEASEVRYRRLFESAKDGILLLDADTGEITDINPYLIKLLGYPPQELLRKQLWEIGPFKDIVANKTAFKKLQKEQYIRYEDLPLETKEGKSMAVEFVSNVYLVDGKNVIQCNIRDITGRKKAEEEIRRLSKVFLDGTVPTIIEDLDGNTQEMNDEAINAYGWAREELIGKQIKILVPENRHEQADALLERCKAGETVRNVETVRMKKNGTEIPTLLSLSLLTGEGDKPIGIATIATDITERKQAEKEQNILTNHIAEKNKELEQIIYITSHDLRSPLVNVQGFSRELGIAFKDVLSALKSEDIPKDVEKNISTIIERDILESLQYITTSIAKMDSLLSGVLKISRLGRVELKKGQLNMSKLISDVNKSYQYQIDQANAHIEASELPGCYGDETQINQVFSNLVGNSLKYLDPGRPGSIKISGQEEKGQSIYCIEDNGIGIAPEHNKNIFDMFHQLEPGASKGEGLGLTIVRKIVEKHQGKVWVESEPGKGSKFYVSLPGIGNMM